jgi:hypothetical protein
VGERETKMEKNVDEASAQTWRLQGGLSSVNSQWPAYQIVSCYPSHGAEKKKNALHFCICISALPYLGSQALQRQSHENNYLIFTTFLAGCICMFYLLL